MTQLRIAVLGTGATGGYFGGRLAEAGEDVRSIARGVHPPDIRAAMWNKFLFITALSGVGAVTRAPVGVIRSLPATRGLLREALEEIYSLAVRAEIALPADAVERTLAFIDGLPPDGTASMQRDVLAGRPSELEAQVGAVVRLGERLGVEVPVHRTIYAALLPQERRARGGEPG
jgi:2-dehydropantoate 2-reductase